MKLVTILADSAAEALAEVHRQLGPQAVVVNVRRASPPGLSRIWKKPQIEVQATVPAPPTPRANPASLDLFRNVKQLKRELDSQRQAAPRSRPEVSDPPPRSLAERPRSRKAETVPAEVPKPEVGLAKMLENLGILPLHAQRLVEQVRARAPEARNPGTLRDEFAQVQELLVATWRKLTGRVKETLGSVHVLVGAPGVGKTTCICKWLTQEILFENRTARVWRLDGHAANTAEFLSIHGEILGVPVERVWDPEPSTRPPDMQFIDLPGVCVDDLPSISSLSSQLQSLQPAQVLLVLNSAYDLAHLLEQVRAFSELPISGLIMTHVDEDSRWSKFWNVLLSSNLPVLYLSGGQSIPGVFVKASPDSLFDVGLEASQDRP